MKRIKPLIRDNFDETSAIVLASDQTMRTHVYLETWIEFYDEQPKIMYRIQETTKELGYPARDAVCFENFDEAIKEYNFRNGLA